MTARALPGRVRALVAAALAATALLACGTLREVTSTNPVPGVRAGTWEVARNQATRRARLYDRLSHRATVTATYLSAPVREARVERLASWLTWTEEEKQRRLKAEREEADRYEDFVVSFFAADRRSNDLDAKDSVWRLALQVDGGDRVTHDATVLDMDATLVQLFPYVGPFDVVYRVRFDKVAGEPLAGRRFEVLISSAYGKLPLVFNDGAVGPDRPPGTPLPE